MLGMVTANMKEAAPVFQIHPNPVIKLQPIVGDQVCVVVDDFLLDPEQVVAFALDHASEFSMPERSYPGLVLELDNDWMTDIYHIFRTKMSKQFSFLRGDIESSTLLSIATLQPEEFTCLQRLCHSNPRTAAGRENYAGLLYLFKNTELGGTGFYRWKERTTIERATAMEEESPGSAMEYLQEKFEMFREPASYITESNEVAEFLTMIPPKFNRLIFYPGDIPHSAYITAPELLSDDISNGRLTLNVFASVWPRQQ